MITTNWDEPLKPVNLNPRVQTCERHRFFVASTVGVEAEGTVHVIIVCTACGIAECKGFQVSKGNSPLKLEYPVKMD